MDATRSQPADGKSAFSRNTDALDQFYDTEHQLWFPSLNLEAIARRRYIFIMQHFIG